MKKTHIIITYVVLGLGLIASIVLSILYSNIGYAQFENSLTFKGGTGTIISGIIVYFSVFCFLVLFVASIVKKRAAFIGNAFTTLCLTDLSLAYFDYKEVKTSAYSNSHVPAIVIGVICGVLGLFGIVFGFICIFKKFDAAPVAVSNEETSAIESSASEKEEGPAEEKADESAIDPNASNEAATPAEEESKDAQNSSNTSETVSEDCKEETAQSAATEGAATEKEAAEVATETQPASSKNLGKYEVFPEAGFYKYRLKANNGQILTVSNSYKTKDGALKGIATFRKNVESGSHRIVMDKKGNAQWRIFTANDSRLVVAGETYPNVDGAQKALNSVLRFYSTEKVVTLDKISDKEIREWRAELPELKKSQNGKIEIFQDEDSKWIARLVASNGEVLFLTTTYAAKTSLTNSISNIKENALKGNVSIVCDKQNRYQFKVFASNGVVLVLGETYPSKDNAISSAASMRNFLNGEPKIVDLTKKAAD